MKYRITTKPETGEMAFGSDDITSAEWLAKELVADFGQAKVFELIGENATGEPIFKLLRSYAHPVDKQQALSL